MNSSRRRITLFVVILALVVTTGCSFLPWKGITRKTTEGTVTPIAVKETPPPATSPPQIPTPTITGPDADERLFVELYREVNPSVVSIQIIRKATELELMSQELTPDVNQYTRSQGSGFIIDGAKGIVLTNNHVVEGAEVVEAILWDGTVMPAEILGRDPDSDSAVLQIEAKDRELQGVTLGDSDAVEVGQRVLIIGNPFGWQGTLTSGIVSGLGRTLMLGHISERVSGRFSIPEMIQTDAAVNFGNSGGPMIDSSGLVIGITTAMDSSSGVSSGVGFAVPINALKRILPDLIDKGHYDYPWVGITGTDLRPIHVEEMDLPVDHGATIVHVTEGGPAEKAGLRGGTSTKDYYGEEISLGGDVIVAIDDTPVRQFDDVLVYLIRETRPGDTVRLGIIRDGKDKEITITLAKRPTD